MSLTEQEYATLACGYAAGMVSLEMLEEELDDPEIDEVLRLAALSEAKTD